MPIEIAVTVTGNQNSFYCCSEFWVAKLKLLWLSVHIHTKVYKHIALDCRLDFYGFMTFFSNKNSLSQYMFIFIREHELKEIWFTNKSRVCILTIYYNYKKYYSDRLFCTSVL